MRGLTGKTAVVTGGATLIGSAVVAAHSASGTSPSRSPTSTSRAASALAGASSARACCFVAHRHPRRRALAALVDRGRRDASAGSTSSSTSPATYVDDGFASTREDWLESAERERRVSAVMAAKAVHPHLVARGGGAIVNFTSISSKVAQTGRWLYPVSKAALVQLTRNMAMDLAGDGIRVNSVSPGWTWSKVMVELTGDDRAKTDRVAAPFHLLGRVGDPEEVGAGRRVPLLRRAPRSSPAPTGPSTAATRRWARSRRCPRSPSSTWN